MEEDKGKILVQANELGRIIQGLINSLNSRLKPLDSD